VRKLAKASSAHLRNYARYYVRHRSIGCGLAKRTVDHAFDLRECRHVTAAVADGAAARVRRSPTRRRASKLPRMQLERQFAGPLQDTVIQRWRDPVDGTICYPMGSILRSARRLFSGSRVPCRFRRPFHCGNRTCIRRSLCAANPCSAVRRPSVETRCRLR